MHLQKAFVQIAILSACGFCCEAFAGPPSVTLTINGGATYTNSTSVSLTMTATGSPTQMYITATAGCGSGGSWVPYASSAAWTLGKTNSTNTIYVMVKNTKSSSCASASIIHDSIPPVAQSLAINGGAAYAGSPSVTLTLSATGTPSQMYITNTAGCGSGGSWSPYATSAAWTLLDLNAQNTVYVKFRDAATNESACISSSIIEDGTPTTLTVTAPLNNSYVNAYHQSNFTATGTCSADGQLVQVSGGLTASTTCSGGSWTMPLTFWNMPDQAYTLTFSHSDRLGQPATPVSRVVTRDSLIPTVAFTSPVYGSWINLSNDANVTVAGTCSANGQPVVLSGVVTATLKCKNGRWSTTANLSSAPQGNLPIWATLTDIAGNIDTEPLWINIGTVAPALAVTSPPANSIVTSLNSWNYKISGTCTALKHTVDITGSATGSGTCRDGIWSAVVDVHLLPDGPLNFKMRITDDAGNTASSTLSLVKLGSAPGVKFLSPVYGSWINLANAASVQIAGTCGQNGQNVVLSGAVNATLPCANNSFSTVVDLTSAAQGNVGIRAVHSDGYGDSADAWLWINIDTVAPTVSATSPPPGTQITTFNVSSWPLAGTCSAEKHTVAITGSATASSVCNNGAWSVVLNLQALADGPLSFNIDSTDSGGNPAHASTTYTKAASLPGVSFTSPIYGSILSRANAQAVTVSGTCGQSGHPVTLNGIATATAPCVNNLWSTTVDLSAAPIGNDGLRAVHSDGNGNTTDNWLWINIAP